MDGKRIAVLAALAFLAVVASATELHCIFNEQLCDQWKDNKNASQGNVNGVRFCCPPEPGQGLKLTSLTPDPENCICRAGTAEKYANLTSTTTTKPAGDGNSASGLMPHSVLLAVILLSIVVGVSLLR